MSEIQRVRVSCRTIVVDDEQLLLQNINDREFWNFPGGGFEESDASFADAALRETQEEAGMDVAIEKLVYVQKHENNALPQLELFFLAKPLDVTQYREYVTDPDKPELDNRLKWFSFSELHTMDVRPIELVDQLQQVISNAIAISPQDI